MPPPVDVCLSTRGCCRHRPFNWPGWEGIHVRRPPRLVRWSPHASLLAEAAIRAWSAFRCLFRPVRSARPVHATDAGAAALLVDDGDDLWRLAAVPSKPVSAAALTAREIGSMNSGSGAWLGGDA